MRKFYYIKKRPEKINFKFLAVLFPFFILLTLFISLPSFAQQFGSLVTYHDEIDFDEEGGALLHPSFVMVAPPENDIYIIDGKGRVTIYASDFFPLYTFKKGPHLQSPQGMTVDAEGNIYIAQAASEGKPRGRISVFRQCLKWERDIYLGGFEGEADFRPYRLAVDKKGFIYVASNYFLGVLVLDNDDRLVDIMAPEERGEKVALNNVTIDGEGRIYLLSEKAGRAYVYDEDRKFLFKFGEKGGSSGKLSRPRALAVDDRTGRKYIVDYMRHSVNVYDKEGKFIYEFGGMGWQEGWFQYPGHIAIDNEGRLFIADLFNNRVQVFNSW
jgi:DNA-binding beta-propeller fold protein YncE